MSITPGIKDDLFIRKEVPMTKEEVRVISLCKLQLEKDSVLYDVGSGTGSVSVEAARLSEGIKVFAIESNPEAAELTAMNAEKFGVKNIQVANVMAPEGFEKLPVPTHAFIGGTRGHLKEILSALYKKNSSMRIVLNAVSMESVTETFNLLKEFKVLNVETVQVQINKTKPLGGYNMLSSGNPVFVFSFDFQQ